MDLMIPDKRLSMPREPSPSLDGSPAPTRKATRERSCDALAEEYGFDLHTPFQDLPEEIQHMLIYGTDGREVTVHYKGKRGEGYYDVAFEGLIKNVQRRYRENHSERQKAEYENFMTVTPCDACHGQRLKEESLAVTVGAIISRS